MARKKHLKDYLQIGSLGADWFLNNLYFVVFVAFLLLFYIANAHYAEKKVRLIQTLQKEVKDIRSAYITQKSELMVNSRLTEIEKEVVPFDLKIDNQHPLKVIEINP